MSCSDYRQLFSYDSSIRTTRASIALFVCFLRKIQRKKQSKVVKLCFLFYITGKKKEQDILIRHSIKIHVLLLPGSPSLISEAMNGIFAVHCIFFSSKKCCILYFNSVSLYFFHVNKFVESKIGDDLDIIQIFLISSSKKKDF